MRAGYRVLRGRRSPGRRPRFSRADLRQALERELRGKLLRLRQGYAAAAGDEKLLGELAAAERRHHPGAAPLAPERWRGRPVPAAPAALAAEAAALVGVPAEALLTPVERRGERGWRCTASQFEQYMDAVARAAGYVDQLQLGDQ